jgi:hypothetical protein
MGDVWRREGENNNNNIRKVVSKRWIDTERQKMEANMRVKRSLTLYNELKSSLEREKYININICTFEEIKGTGWRKRMRGNIDKDVCRKEEGWSNILQCEGTRVWTDRWLERKFTSRHPEIGIKK